VGLGLAGLDRSRRCRRGIVRGLTTLHGARLPGNPRACRGRQAA
jgi:hypothetical protein